VLAATEQVGGICVGGGAVGAGGGGDFGDEGGEEGGSTNAARLAWMRMANPALVRAGASWWTLPS
jgi:hypothetical protein